MATALLANSPWFRGVISATPSGTVYFCAGEGTVVADLRDTDLLFTYGYTLAPGIQNGPTFTVTTDTAPVVIDGGTGAFPGTLPSGTDAVIGSLDNVAARYVAISFGQGGLFSGLRAQGTRASPSAVTAGLPLQRMQAFGWGATGWSSAARATVSFVTAENWTDAAQGTRVEVQVTKNLGTITSTVIRFDNDGALIVDPAGVFSNDGVTKLVTVGPSKATFLAEGTSNNLTLTGSNQAGALQLTTGFNVFGTVAANTGAKLPAIGTTVPIGTFVDMFNIGLNTGTIYSAGSETIDGVAGATGVPISTNVRGFAFANSASTWVTAQYGAKLA